MRNWRVHDEVKVSEVQAGSNNSPDEGKRETSAVLRVQVVLPSPQSNEYT